MEKLTPFQFAKSIKDKYPQYVDVDDIELTNKILSKYPQYNDRVDLLAGASPLIPYEQEKNWLGVDLDTDKTQEEEKNIQIPEKLGNLSVDLEPLPEVGVTTESVFGTKKPEYGEKRGGENYAQVANKAISENPQATANQSISSLLKEVDKEYTELSKRDKVQSPVKSASIKPYQYLNATDEVTERNLMSAHKMLEDADKILNSPVDKKTGTWFDIAGDRIASWGKGAGERLTNEDFWTMGMSNINRNISALNIAKKLEKGEQLRRDEELLLDSFANLQFANMVRADNMSSAYRGGQGTVDMAAFIAQLVTTGGLGKLATKGAEKALVKVIAKKVSGKFAQHLANTGTKILTRTGAAFIGAAIAPATFEKTTENLFGNALGEFKGIDLKYTGRWDAMTGFDSYINAWADLGIEFATEMSGGSLGVIGKVIKEVPGIDKVLKRLARTKLGSAGRILGNNPILKQAGVHGFLGEYNEEFDGAVVRHLLGLEDFKESFWNWDAQATLLYTLGPVSGFSSGMNGIQGAKIKNDFKNSSKQFDDLLLKNGYSQQEIEDLKIAMLDASPEMLGQQLRSIVGSMDNGVVEVDGKPTFNEEIYGTALQFAIDASKFNAYTQGFEEKLEEYRTRAKAFIEQNQNPDMGAIVYAEVAGKPVRVTKGNIVFNGDKLDRENSSKEFYYENENGEIIPANIELVSKLLEVTPIEQATEVAAQRMTAPLIAKEQNEEVRPYEVGEQVTIDVEGSRVMGQIVEKTENGYKFTDSTGMTIDIEPRQIIDEDNLQGVDNGVLVEYMLNGKPQTGLVEDFYQYRQQGQAIVDGNLVNLSDIIGIAQPETDSNMSEITPENEGTPTSEESNVSEEGRKTEQNDIKSKKVDIEKNEIESTIVDRGKFKGKTRRVFEEKSIEEVEGDKIVVTKYSVKVGDRDVSLGGRTMTIKEFREEFPISDEMKTDEDTFYDAWEDDDKITIFKIKEAPDGSRFNSVAEIKIGEDILTIPIKKNNAKYDAELAELEKQPTAAGETPVAEQQAEQEKQTFMESLPVNNKGEIDQKKMTVAQTIQYFEYQYGVDETLKAAEQQVKNIEKQLKTAETALSKDPFNIAKKKRASQIQAELQEYKDYVFDKKKAKLRQVETSTSSIIEEERRAEAEAQRQAYLAEIEALHGVPDVTVDKAKDARARGYRIVNGERVNRQEATTPTHFTETQRKFSDKVSVPVKRTIVEAETLQPSHKNGVKNDKFFITEAQPKPRTDDASQYAAESIASNINPQEITGGVTAYTGAPIVNNHHEVIQGNNRVTGLQLMHERRKKQAEKYKQHLIENAADYGMTAEQVDAMTNPVAVDIAEVSDEEAIRLGQLNATDTESGGLQRIPAQQSAVSLGEDIGRLSSILYESGEDDLSMHEALYNNGKKALEYLSKKGIINNTQFQSAFDSRNNLTPEAKKDLQDITAFALFEGANDNMQQMFRALPDKAQKAILQTIHRNAANPEGSSIMNDIRGAIEAYYLLKQDESFNTNTEYEVLIRLATQLKGQTQLFNTETNLPLQKYSNFAIELAVLFKSDKQNTLKSRFNNLYDALQGVGGDMFHPAETLNLVEAIKKHFNNIDYVPNGQVQRNNVAKHNTERKARQQLGDEAAATREQSEKGEQPSQRGRGNEGNNKEEVTLLKGQDLDKINQELSPIDNLNAILSGEKVVPVQSNDKVEETAEKRGESGITNKINSQDPELNPTEAQKEAGNYKKAHINIQGFDITIENPKGSTRSGIDENGREWSNTLQNHYGYFKRTEGKDGDQIDVFIGENPESETVFVVDQNNPESGAFDESKVMLGFNTPEEAKAAYMSNYEGEWKGFGSITPVSVEDFKKWLYDGAKQIKPFSEYKDTPEAVEVEKPAEKQEKLNDEVEKSGQSLAEESEAVKELRKEIKDLKSQKAKLIKDMSDRNGLFGDTKSDPNDLFGGGEVDSNAFVSKLDEINNRIKTVNDKIKKQIKAEATGKTEAKQQSINLGEESSPKQETSGQKKSEKLSETESDKAVSQEDKKSEKDKSFPKEKSKEDKSGQKVEKIEDFGEKIEGARKHLATLNTSTKEDITSMPLSKSFPKPDFNQLVESGQMTIDGAIVMNYLYESIPSKPRKHYRVAGWANKVQGVIDAYNTLLENSEHAAKIVEKLEKHINEFKLYSATLKALGFPANNVSMGGHKIKQFYGHEGYSIVNGSFILGTYAELEDAAKALSEIINKKKTKTTETKLNIYQDGKTGKYFVGRKGAVGVVRLIDGIETIEEARKVYKEQQPQLQQMWNDLKIDVNERRSTNSPRVGTDYRKGKDVTPEDFNIFGFRGVQFGNYVNPSERQQSLNQAYDSLYDLANVLGISPKAISLNGELGLAFGARGSGGKNAASAHYEPDMVVINLTKKKGAGSLAHEWWHAMDNYFERARGRKINYLTDSPSTRFNADGSKDLRVREEVSQAFKEVVATIKQSGMGKRSEVLDQARSKAYWSTVIEMSARSFENYIIEKLGETGQRNDYLANFKAMSEWVEDGGVDMSSYPYPTVEETPEINKAFDNLFNTIEETESGELREPELQYGKKSITKQEVSAMVEQLLKTGLAKEVRMVTPEEIAGILEGNEQFATDRAGNQIGDGSWNVQETVFNFEQFPQVSASVSKSATTESTYVTYTNSDNGKNITVRFSNHENNAVRFGDQLDGNVATGDQVLFHLGLKTREFVPDKYLSIWTTQVAKKNLGQYEQADKTIQELYAMGANADISEYKGKLAKGSNYLILGDTVKELTETRRNILGQEVEIGTFNYKDVQFLRTPSGTIYGFVKGGVVYLNSTTPNLNAPIHEFGHLWIDAIEGSELYNRGAELVKNTPYWDRVNADSNYKNLSETARIKEAMAMAIGDKGEAVKRYLGKFARIKTWIKDVWKRIGVKFGIQNLTPEQIQNLTFNDFVDVAVSELMAGQRLTTKGEQKTKLPKTINIDGVERSTTNSEGKPIHSTEEGVRNFYEWFGDSKVVDEQGRPLVVYHGKRTPEQFYSFKKGMNFFSDNLPTAEMFAEENSHALIINGEKRSINKREAEEIQYIIEPYENLEWASGWDLWEDANESQREALSEYLSTYLDYDSNIESLEINLPEEPVYGVYLNIKNPAVKDYSGKTWGEEGTHIEADMRNAISADNKIDGFVAKNIREGGFSAEINGEDPPVQTTYVTTNPNQIKSATSNTGEFSPEDASILNEPGLQYKVSETGFYSTVEKALSAITQEKGTRDQFKAMLLKNGAKQAELDLMDYDGTFTGKSVTKTEIQDWIDQNRIEVEEVEKGISKVEVKSIEPVSEKYATVFTVTFSDNSTVEVDLSGKYDNDPSDISEREIAEEAQKLRAEDDLTYEGDEEIRPTKYSQHTLPGGKNYRELLLTMPNNKAYKNELNRIAKKYGVEANYISIRESKATDDELAELRRLNTKPTTFKSAHFDEPNILAHVRFKERTDSEGSRVLFIEEWQGDKGQEWQKLKKLIDSGKATKADIDRFNFLDKNFPFNKTSEWLNLAARRMMRYAAENGFDRIAWTTGEQQAERYDLSKQVDEIRYEKVGENYAVVAIGKNGEVVYRSMNATSSELEDAIGKEITQKIVNNEGEDGKVKGTKVLSGENLKIGGSGMKAFYDRIVPSAMSKLGKPFGAKVENIDIPTEKKIDLYSVWNNETGNSVGGGFTLDTANKFINERPDGNYSIKKESSATTTQQSIPVTNSMKETAMEGMPLFEPTQQFINFTPEEIQDETNKAHGSEEKRQEAINKTVESALQTQISGDRREGFDTGRGTTPLRQVRTVLEGFKESGYVDFVGTEVSSHQDIADLWSIHRSPYIEKMHAIFIKDGKIAGSMAVTSGRINQVKSIPPKEIAEHAKKIGATQVYLLHNHPSGLPDVSIPDVYVTFYTADQLRAEGIDLLGQVVVDHDKYSFIDATGEWPADLKTYTLQEWADKTPQFEYKNKVPKLYSEREVISSKDAPKQMFEVARNILSEPTYKGAVVYLTNHHKKGYIAIAAYDILPEGATKEDAIRIAGEGLENNLGSLVVFVHDGSLSGTWGNTPKGTVDVINIAKKDSDYFFNQSSVNEPELEQLWVREGDVEYNPQRELLDSKLNRAQIKFANITVSPSLLREAYQDRHLPVRRFIEQLRETGLNVENFNDWYKQATHLPGKIDAQLEAFERQFLTPMLAEIDKLIKQGHSYRDVENYAILKHGLERNEYMKNKEADEIANAKVKKPSIRDLENDIDQSVLDEYNATLEQKKEEALDLLDEKDYSGITAVQEEVEMSAEDYIKQFEEKSNTDSFWNAVKQATKYSLDKAYEGQIINKEQYNELTNRYKYYIPLRGFDKEIAEDRWDYTPDMGTYYVMPLIKAKGRTSRSETPFAFIWQMAQTSISSANKNLHNLSIKRLAELDNKRYASTGLMSISRTWYEKTDEHTWELRSPEYSQDNDTYQKNIEEFENRMKLLEEQGFATQKKGKLNVGMFIKPKQAAQHEVHVMQNGEEFVIYFNGNPRVARAINGANAIHNQPNQVQQAVRQATRMMAANFTTRNPLFVLSNFLRDYNYASSTLIVKEGVEYEALFQKNIPLVMGALHRAIRGKPDMTNKMDVYAYEYLMNGGRTGYSSIMELNRVQKRVERKIKRHGKDDMFNAALEGLKTANEFAENLTRLSVYVTSREVGRDIIQSISDAKEVTVNFNRGGSGELGGNFFKNYYLFFNANIQALDNHFKIWKGNPGRMAALTGAYALSGFIAPFLVALIGGDDGEEEYMKLSDWERQTNFSIYTGNGFIKIPIAHELRVYHTMGDLAYQWMMGYITSGDAAKKMTLAVSDIIPANPMGATEASWAELSPDLPKPFVQLVTNTSFMGTRIYDKYKVEQDIPGFRMVRTNKKGEAFAPEFLIRLAEGTHYITGGDGTKGGLDFNPDKLNHIMRGYFGGLYTMASQAADITSKGISAIDTGEFKLKVRETPLKTFYASSDDLMERNSKLNAGYYDIKKESDQVRKWGKDYIKRAEKGEISIDELYKKLNEINYYYYEGGSAVGINDFLKDINKMENMLKEVPPEEQEYLEMEINRYKKDLINFYQKATKSNKK